MNYANCQEKTEPEKKNVVAKMNKMRVVTNCPLNIRAASSFSSEILGRLNHGDVITKISAKKGWVKFRFDDKTFGYVYEKYMEEVVDEQ